MTTTMTDRLNGINEGVAMKAAVVCATTANITLSGLQTIDGITTVADDRVLVKNQTDTTKNGIYNASTGTWTRAADFDGARDIIKGTLVYVISGTVNGNKLYQVNTTDPVIGEALSFVQTSVMGSGFANVKDFGYIGDGVANPLSGHYSTLAEAQVDYPQADALTDEVDSVAIEKALAYAVSNNINTIYFPPPSVIGGYGRINKFIDIPYTLGAREGIVNLVGDIATADRRNYVTTLVRTVSAAGFRFIGTSLSVDSNNKLIKRVNTKSLTFNGGWSSPSFNTNADYPMIDCNSGYEFIWEDTVVTQALGHGILFREVMDSRFENCRITWCGQRNGYQKSVTMTSGSTTATVSSTTGLYAGQRIYGTGLQTVRIASITNSTTFVLSTAANFSGTRTCGFEAKAAMEILSTNNTVATSNNLVLNGFRFENGGACGLRIQGSNIIDIFINDFKIEYNSYTLDYLLDVVTASGVFVRNGWLYSSPSFFNRMEWSITTSGKTLATASSNTRDSFTLNTYTTDTGTFTSGSAIVTGLASTTNLTVGQVVLGSAVTSSPSSLAGCRIASIDSPTQITMTDNAVATGSYAVTFQYYFDSGIFYRKGFFTGMPIICYDADDTRNYQLCRVTNYGITTGVLDLHVLNVFGDTSKSITNWKVAATHIGCAYFGNSAITCEGHFEGGYPASVAPTTYPYIHSYIHLDGIKGYLGRAYMNAGSNMLPKNTWQAQVSTSSVAVGTGSKTFTIGTGLHATMFAAGAAVYISGNTVATAQTYMIGTVTSYNSGTGQLDVSITRTSGSGTLTNWSIAFAPQPLHLQTGTNTDVSLVEICPVYGTPASSSGSILPINSDVKAASGSTRISSVVQLTSGLYSSITKDSSTVYIVTDVGQVYVGSTSITAPASNPFINGFRLTLTSGSPVTTSDVTAAATVYCTPYEGSQISLYNGSSWAAYTSNEFSLALGTITSSKPYDVFAYNNSGTVTLEMLAWTNDTTRATSLAYQNGVLVKSGDATRRYLGSFYTTSATTTEDSKANRYLWNYYHRTRKDMFREDSTASWNYTTATIRAANGSTSNRLNFLVGIAEDTVNANLTHKASNTNANVRVAAGLALDSTTSMTHGWGEMTTISAGLVVSLTSRYSGIPSVGKHYISWNEYSEATGTTTWYGNTTNGICVTGDILC